MCVLGGARAKRARHNKHEYNDREREDHKSLGTSSNATDSSVKVESSLEMSSDTDSQTPSLLRVLASFTCSLGFGAHEFLCASIIEHDRRDIKARY